MKTVCVLFCVLLGVVAERVKICTLEYSPECGVDGKVYGNRCMRTSEDVEQDVSWERCRGSDLCPDICTMEYNPVCGSDGKTYPSRCAMQSANCGKLMFVRSAGECESNDYGMGNDLCPKICTMEYNPVCGTDGKTYPSRCAMQSANCGKLTFVRHMGECESDNYAANSVICPMIYAPECGQDGKVYGNDCERRGANVEKDLSWESCRGHELCPRACTREYNPVCGSDGKTYSTRCVMQSLNCGKLMTVRHQGQCEDQEHAKRAVICPMIYAPECGQDGKVYGNDCERSGANVEKAESWESCRGHELCPRFCTKEYNPVCGNDGKTYATRCVMQFANCGKLMTVRHHGACTELGKRSAICTMQYAPECGQDGKVYGNDCERSNANVELDASWKSCRGHELCPMACTREYRPVCGSDGKTYSTKCVMQSLNCGKLMTVRHAGQCESEEYAVEGICPMIYAPVCGQDGQVYGNDCQRKNALVEQDASWSKCRGRHELCPVACLANYLPVCGSDGKIYSNKCVMQAANCGKLMFVRAVEECESED